MLRYLLTVFASQKGVLGEVFFGLIDFFKEKLKIFLWKNQSIHLVLFALLKCQRKIRKLSESRFYLKINSVW